MRKVSCGHGGFHRYSTFIRLQTNYKKKKPNHNVFFTAIKIMYDEPCVEFSSVFKKPTKMNCLLMYHVLKKRLLMSTELEYNYFLTNYINRKSSEPQLDSKFHIKRACSFPIGAKFLVKKLFARFTFGYKLCRSFYASDCVFYKKNFVESRRPK